MIPVTNGDVDFMKAFSDLSPSSNFRLGEGSPHVTFGHHAHLTCASIRTLKLGAAILFGE
jgi:hypothetical protein